MPNKPANSIVLCRFFFFFKEGNELCGSHARNIGVSIIRLVSCNDKINLTFFCGYILDSVLKILPTQSQCFSDSCFNNWGDSKNTANIIHILIDFNSASPSFSDCIESIGNGNSRQNSTDTSAVRKLVNNKGIFVKKEIVSEAHPKQHWYQQRLSFKVFLSQPFVSNFIKSNIAQISCRT